MNLPVDEPGQAGQLPDGGDAGPGATQDGAAPSARDLVAEGAGPPADGSAPSGSDEARTARTEARQADDAVRRAAARRRLDEIFGDVLPDVTRDELEDRQAQAQSDRDAWFRANLPPHHG